MNNFVVKFAGSAGEQFGKKMYTTSIPFSVAENLLEVYPEVQRKLNKPRAKSLATYILRGLNPKNLCFLSALTTTARGEIDFDEDAGQVSIGYGTKLSVNDGQHRYEGIKIAVNALRAQASKLKGDERKRVLQALEQLQNMCIPVVIFEEMDEIHEQQLFHDLNLLASKPTKSVSMKFDNNDLYTRMAKELKDENDCLSQYGVETERTILTDRHPEIMVLSTLRHTISYMIAGTDKDKNNALTPDNYDEWKAKISALLDAIFYALPDDCNDRTKYILGTAATFQGIGKYCNHLIANLPDLQQVVEKLSDLGHIDWSHSNVKWNGYGGQYDSGKGRFIFSGTGAGVNGICNALLKMTFPSQAAV